MNEDRILSAVNEILADVFLRDDIAVGRETTAKDVEGWDSMRHIEIIIALEQRFNIRFKSSELDHMKSVGDMISIVASKSAA